MSETKDIVGELKVTEPSLRRAALFTESGPSIQRSCLRDPFSFFSEIENPVLNYGFEAKLDISPALRLNVRDLWTWLRSTLESLAAKKPPSQNLNRNLMNTIRKIVSEPTDIVGGYEVCSIKSLEFNQLFAPNYDEFYEKDFLRYLVYKFLFFDYQEARKGIESKIAEAARGSIDPNSASKDSQIPIKELHFINNFLKAIDPKSVDNQMAVSIWRKTVDFQVLDNPYMKFIQFILSERFLQSASDIMHFPGVHFLDRLFLLVKFFPRRADALLKEFIYSNKTIEVIPLIIEDSARVASLLQKFLDETFDIVTVGLASKLLGLIAPQLNLAKFSEALDELMINHSLTPVSQIIRRELALLNSKAVVAPWSHDDETNVKFFCYWCQNSGSASSMDEKMKGSLISRLLHERHEPNFLSSLSKERRKLLGVPPRRRGGPRPDALQKRRGGQVRDLEQVSSTAFRFGA